MLRSGASGYVLKSAGADELVAAVRAVARGEVFLYPSMAKKLLNDYLFRIEVSPENQPALSAREKEVLRMLAEGYSNKEIADKLVLSPSTVYTHRSNLMQKLGLDSRRELVQYARQHGLITENPLDGKMNE
jgi:two-component system response regulator NreC